MSTLSTLTGNWYLGSNNVEMIHHDNSAKRVMLTPEISTSEMPTLDYGDRVKITFMVTKNDANLSTCAPDLSIKVKVKDQNGSTIVSHTYTLPANNYYKTINLDFTALSGSATLEVEGEFKASTCSGGQQIRLFMLRNFHLQHYDVSVTNYTEIVNNQYEVQGDYRYGFNGQERDDEIKGIGNSYDFGARLYDPRLGRWLSVDAFAHETPSWTPYRFAFNNPIYWVDNDGNREFPSYAAYVEYAKKNKLEVLTEHEIYRQGHWLWLHRIRYQEGTSYDKKKQAVFANAAAINTANLASSEYVNLPQRQAYYGWANNFFTEKGFETKWMKAAEGTVGTLSMALLPPASWFGYSNDEINTFIWNGNKLILDDMMPRINELTSIFAEKGALKGNDALKWDAQTLSDEQNLIQSLYDQLSSESVQILQENLESTYGFEGNVLNAGDRWTFGMKQMGYDVTPDMMPAPGGNYEDVPLQLSE